MRKAILSGLAKMFGLNAVFLHPQVAWLAEEAAPLVDEMDKLVGVSGEYCRRRVYGRMVKDHQKSAPRHWIGMAVEIAVTRKRIS